VIKLMGTLQVPDGISTQDHGEHYSGLHVADVRRLRRLRHIELREVWQ
jgi:hypothetical protein